MTSVTIIFCIISTINLVFTILLILDKNKLCELIHDILDDRKIDVAAHKTMGHMLKNLTEIVKIQDKQIDNTNNKIAAMNVEMADLKKRIQDMEADNTLLPF